jgi:hypothetical protein
MYAIRRPFLRPFSFDAIVKIGATERLLKGAEEEFKEAVNLRGPIGANNATVVKPINRTGIMAVYRQ